MKQDATYNKGATTMKKKTTKPQTRPRVDREAIRVLAIELGAREAARRTGVNENTILSWSRRYKWDLPKRTGGPKAIELQLKAGDVLIASHKELEDRTKSGLARATARAAEAAATAADPLPVSNTAQLRDLAASAARVFGWDKAPQTNVQVNTGFKLTMEQLEQMRALCDNPFKKAAISEGEERKDNKH
jgi:hypothetical protein